MGRSEVCPASLSVVKLPSACRFSCGKGIIRKAVLGGWQLEHTHAADEVSGTRGHALSQTLHQELCHPSPPSETVFIPNPAFPVQGVRRP